MLIKESKLRKIIRQELKSILNERQIDFGDTEVEPIVVDKPKHQVIAPNASRRDVLQFMKSHLAVKAGKPVRLSVGNIRKYSDRSVLKQYRKWYRATRGGRKAVGRRGLTDPVKRAAAAGLSDKELAAKLAATSPAAAKISKGLGADVASLDPIKGLKGLKGMSALKRLTDPGHGVERAEKLATAMAGASGGEEEDPTLTTSGGGSFKGRTKKLKRPRQVAPGKLPTRTDQ